MKSFFTNFRLSFLIIATLVLVACAPNNEISNITTKRPVLTVAGIIHSCPENKIILIERGKAPEGLAMIGGHVEYENPVNAFRRELREELNIKQIDNLRLIGVHGNPGRDPRQHSVEITYSATTINTPQAGSDAKEVLLFTEEELTSALKEKLFAFDHAHIIKNYLKNIDKCNPCNQQCNIGAPSTEYLDSYIKPIKKFNEISVDKLDKETLVLIDIDNTILRSAGHYGSVEFFGHMLDEEIKKNKMHQISSLIKSL
jgi:8-oxo-dGTP diphosphatase